MDTSEYIRSNASAWDEASHIHRAKIHESYKASFARDPAYHALDKATLPLVERVGIAGRSVLQLGCNNGKELISLRRWGAAECSGVDISAGFIEQARELALVAGVDVDFVCADALAFRTSRKYDIVLVTVGFIQWLPDLEAIMRTIAGHLTSGGLFLFSDYHPVGTMFSKKEDAVPNLAVFNYFDRQAEMSTSGLDYVDGVKKPYKSQPLYYFKRTLAEYLTCAADNGLALRYLVEHPFDVAGIAGRLQAMDISVPLSFGAIFRLENSCGLD